MIDKVRSGKAPNKASCSKYNQENSNQVADVKNFDKVLDIENTSKVLGSACKTIAMCLALSGGRSKLAILGNADEWEYEFDADEISDEMKRGKVRLVIFWEQQ